MRLFQALLAEGAIQNTYAGLMGYFGTLKTHFKRQYPQFAQPGGTYYGMMDMTYFSLLPEFLKERQLKIAVVFVYGTFSFEVWLSGANRDIQAAYWEMIKASGWDQYTLSSNPKKEDFILGKILAADPDFGNLDLLTEQIATETAAFIIDIERFLRQNVL
jgi:hypothetical protein